MKTLMERVSRSAEAGGKPIGNASWRWVRTLLLASLLLLLSSSILAEGPNQTGADTRPNIVLFVVDDSGYSDFAPFGGEALTPNVDALASAGIKLTNFHALPTCSVARSTFLSGVDNHLNGMGTMMGQVLPQFAAGGPQAGQAGYEGFLADRAISVAQLLKDAGYHTYHVGKWHLAQETESERGIGSFVEGTWPTDRGFEMSYGMLEGGGEHYGSCERAEGHCTHFHENNQIISRNLPPDYFSGKAHTDKAIEYIDAGKTADAGNRKPFFLYYADTMAHEPLQVPDEYIKQEYIDEYYAKGWDGIRAERFARLQAMGIISNTVPLPPRNVNAPDWNNVNDPVWQTEMDRVTHPLYKHMWDINTVDDLKRTLAKKFAVYRGMIEYYDYSVGRIVQHLKNIGEYDNTLILFLSDDGADPQAWDWDDRDFMARKGIDNTYDNIGRRNSFVSFGPAWAQASNGGLAGVKGMVSEGATRLPLIVKLPANGRAAGPGSVNHAFVDGTDIAATVLDYAGVTHPAGYSATRSWNNCTGTYQHLTNLCPLNGKSMRPLLEGTSQHLHLDEPIGYELFGDLGNGLIQIKALFLETTEGLWKLEKSAAFPFGLARAEPWRLYNLTLDPTTANDVLLANPDKFALMLAQYNQYDRHVGLIFRASSVKRGVAAGTDVVHTFSQPFHITNRSGMTDTFNFVCHSNWTCGLDKQNMELAPLQTGQLNATISVPANAAPGESGRSLINVLLTNSPRYSFNLSTVTVVTGTLTAGPTQPVIPEDLSSFMPIVNR